jgi:hypothetical protein
MKGEDIRKERKMKRKGRKRKGAKRQNNGKNERLIIG